MSTPTTVRCANTDGFSALAHDSKGRNRGPNKKLLEALDLDGIHVVAFSMIHNDVELRHLWMCKLIDEQEPVKVWMDNSFEAVERCTWESKVQEQPEGSEE